MCLLLNSFNATQCVLVTKTPVIYSAKLPFRSSSQWNVRAYLAGQATEAQGSSAIMRDRHVARSLVKVAAGRLPGSVKIRWQIQNTSINELFSKRGKGRHSLLNFTCMKVWQSSTNGPAVICLKVWQISGSD